MVETPLDLEGIKLSIDHFNENFYQTLMYVFNNCRDNNFLRNRWREFCRKVSHGIVLIEFLHKFSNELNEKYKDNNHLSLSILFSRLLGSSILLLWEIYKLLYTNWLKFLIEPSIIHKEIYPLEISLDDLKKIKVFTDPSKIELDTHEIARRVAKKTTQFDPYVSYLLIGIISDIDNIVYLSYNEDKYVNVEKKDVDPENKLDFKLLGKAIKLLTVWRAQFAHYGDYLLACDEISKEVYEEHPPPNFDAFHKESLRKFSSQSLIFLKYFERLFWELGEVVRIQNEAYQHIDQIFNYK